VPAGCATRECKFPNKLEMQDFKMLPTTSLKGEEGKKKKKQTASQIKSVYRPDSGLPGWRQLPVS
jgi:hypothetical protein